MREDGEPAFGPGVRDPSPRAGRLRVCSARGRPQLFPPWDGRLLDLGGEEQAGVEHNEEG